MENCIEWQKSKDKAGYGVSWYNGQWIRAHRKAYIEAYGSIPDGFVVRHVCDNRACVNPEHLIVGTHKQNSEDMVVRDRQAKGVKVGTSVLTDDLVLMIRSLSGPSRKLAAFFGCSKTTILAVKNNTLWKHVK